MAKAVGVVWYTAQMHLNKLKDDGKVKMLRIRRQNQWILTEDLKEQRDFLFEVFL